MPYTYNSKTDANQKEIVEVLRRAGATVQLLHMVGAGCPDILAGYFDVLTGEPRNALMEIKTKEGRLNEKEEEWHAEWKGQVAVVRSPEEALAVIGRLEVENVF